MGVAVAWPWPAVRVCAFIARRSASSFIASNRTCDSQVLSAFDGLGTQSGPAVVDATDVADAVGGSAVAGDEFVLRRTLRATSDSLSDSLSDSSSLMSRTIDASMPRSDRPLESSVLARLDGGGEASGRKYE